MVNVVPVAAFDLDGTLIAGQSQVMLLRTLAERRDVSPGALAVAGFWLTAVRLGWRGSGRSARSLIMGRYEGRTLAWIDEVVAETIELRLAPAAFVEGVRRLRDLESAGVRTVIVSASLDPLVAAVAVRFGASGGCGTRLRQAGGCLGTGLDGPVLVGRHKAEAVRDWASRRFGSWRLVEAFGDGRSDIEMLELAQQPTVTNPDRFMARYATRMGWNVAEWGGRGRR